MKIDLLIDLKDFSPETVLFSGLVLGIILAGPAGFLICALFASKRASREYRRGRTDMEKLIRDRAVIDTRGGDFYDHMAVVNGSPERVPMPTFQREVLAVPADQTDGARLVFEHGTAKPRR
jgi:hypothetical protein